MADSCNVVLLPSVKIEPVLDEENDLSFETTLESPSCDSQTRFGDTSEEEIQRLLEDKNTANTKKATKTAVNIFREYLREKGLDTCFEDFDKNVLNNVLKKFYVEARKRDGDFYKKSALSSIRFALSRHLQSTRNIDIINDPEFRVSAEVFRAQAVELVRRGKGSIDHFADITPDDLKKLYFSDILNVNSPEGLLRKVFFDLMYLAGSKRSRGTLREQTKDTYGIAEDSEKNLKFIYLKKKSLGLNSYPWKIYEKKGNVRCPVANFAKYLSKLNPLSSFLWQRPKKNVLMEDDVWYENSPLGHNTLGKMMDTMSREARLSKMYSNYCLKGTHASLLNDPTLQNSMLLIKTKLISENGHALPKIVPKPAYSLSAIPCVSIAQPASTMQTVATSNQSLQEEHSFVLSTNDQKQSTPLNTPLTSSIGASSNSHQVILPLTSATSQSQMVGPPVVVSTYGSLYSLAPHPQSKMPGSPLTTHVLDTSSGTPARQLPVKVFYHEEVQNGSSWKVIASGATNGDGRVPNLLTQERFKSGHYKIKFDTETYYKSLAVEEYFYPYVEIVFTIKDPSQHYHVPLLLSPFGYSTYRGS
ncbi:uric acid degradation bifunctional protein TTL-like [Actinia tenebrosa]|uniref:hydroxyisourate hydrolase n=1 Tax=Actinia tenebrosa TaxID=6105 RepID=A0A6P8I8T9_ACTTE|nr:uric acid degradation bifunctional protein TTL-like [Actinia tenebrosa]